MTVNQQKNRKRNCTGKAYFSRELLVKFVRIIGLVRVFFKKLFGNFLTSTYAVARTEHDALVKSTGKSLSEALIFASTKGQIISKCLFGAIVSTKKPTIFFTNFCPSL